MKPWISEHDRYKYKQWWNVTEYFYSGIFSSSILVSASKCSTIQLFHSVPCWLWGSGTWAAGRVWSAPRCTPPPRCSWTLSADPGSEVGGADWSTSAETPSRCAESTGRLEEGNINTHEAHTDTHRGGVNEWMFDSVYRNVPRLRISMVMSTCPCSELWYMASFRALSLAFPDRIRSIWDALLPSRSEPSARISSRDKTSPFPVSVWDRSLRNTFLEEERHRHRRRNLVWSTCTDYKSLDNDWWFSDVCCCKSP